jgi:DNA-directed RNA polymerase subunit RPC12/RpoP
LPCASEEIIKFLIEYQCPQCGAPAVLEETDRLFTCPYCRVKSYLMTESFFRYVLPHAASLNKPLIYFPYWRFKGMLYFCKASGIENRFVDVSQQALAATNFPFSIGFRGQTMKLRFLTSDIEGRFLRPTLPFQKILDTFAQRFSRHRPDGMDPIMHQAQIGETFSLIYSPFYIEDRLHDAVIDKPLSENLPENLACDDFCEERADWRIHFVAALCPQCGWNLDGERDAWVLICKNCKSTWHAVGNKLAQIPFMQFQGRGNSFIYMPFWNIEAETQGLRLNSFSDLIRAANLPRIIPPGQEDMPFRFWIPAFKIRPEIFLRLATHITISQPHKNLTAELPAGRIYPSTLPLKEAVESLKLTLASLIKPRHPFFSRLGDIHIATKRATLVFIPFHSTHHEFIQPDLHLSIHKNVIAQAKSL